VVCTENGENALTPVFVCVNGSVPLAAVATVVCQMPATFCVTYDLSRRKPVNSCDPDHCSVTSTLLPPGVASSMIQVLSTTFSVNNRPLVPFAKTPCTTRTVISSVVCPAPAVMTTGLYVVAFVPTGTVFELDADSAFTMTLPVPFVMICEVTEPVLPVARLSVFAPSVILPLVNVNVPLTVVLPPGTTPPFPFMVTLFAVNPGIDWLPAPRKLILPAVVANVPLFVTLPNRSSVPFVPIVNEAPALIVIFLAVPVLPLRF